MLIPHTTVLAHKIATATQIFESISPEVKQLGCLLGGNTTKSDSATIPMEL